MMKEIIPRRDRPFRRHSNFQIPRATHRCSPPNSIPTRGVHGGQKRHASNALETLPSSSSETPTSHTGLPTDSRTIALQKFLLVSNVSFEQFELEGAWGNYCSVVDCEAVSFLTLRDLLAFSDKILAAIEKHYEGDFDLDKLHEWGLRTRDILETLEPRTVPLSAYDHWRLCLLARSVALTGDLQRATSLIHAVENIPLVYEDRGGVFRVYESIIMSTWRHYDNIRVLEFLILEWRFVGSHLTAMSSKWHHSTPAVLGRSLRQTSYAILASIEHPYVVLADRRDWDNEQRQRMGELLIEVLCHQNLPEDALSVLQEMHKQHLLPTVSLQLTLVRALVREDAFEPANTLYSSITTGSRFKYNLSTGLYLFAHQGDDVRAEEYYHQLADKGWASEFDIAMLLYSYATQGRTEQVLALFSDFFPEGSDGKRLNSPHLLHYSIVIFGHAQRGDFEGMNVWLESIFKAGMVPDLYVYNIILKSFALRGDVDSIAAVLTQMRKAGVEPNVVSYTTVITLLAHRKDPVGAEAIYQRAIREGVIPDRRMISSVMNAHVEAGSWKGVIRAFDYLRSSPTRHIHLTIEVYNTLLKAYVLVGAPFRIVSKLFSKLENAKVRPDAYTFALLIQSACDAGLMNVASDIFLEMDKLADRWQSNLHINAYVLTIIMAGFLRTGDKIGARAVYNDMRERAIQPTSVTFGTILKAYGNEGTEESIQIAEEFIKTLIDAPLEDRAWVRPTHGRKSALDHIYGPLMYAYAKRRNLEDVERLFQDMLDMGGEPSLGILGTLLDVYRRTFNIDSVLQLWPQIFQLGLHYSRVSPLFEGDEYDPTRPRLQANILCIPLSIYIDALSAAGLHLEIATVWKTFQKHGFSFDSHNWNHLVVALVRAGEPERAFEIIERVILPYQHQAKRLHMARDTHPDTPLMFDAVASEKVSTCEPRSEAPMHHSLHRVEAVKVATDKLSANVDIDDTEHGDDFAHPLHILHQISPAWSVWRPHAASLSILLMVLSRLQSGLIVEPVKPDNELMQLEHYSGQTAPKSIQARAMLNRIYKNYPDTVRAVMDHERAERRRLGEEFEQTYNWR